MSSTSITKLFAMLFVLSLGTSGAVAETATGPHVPWRPDHTVIVVLENLSSREATRAQRIAGNAPVYDNPNWSFLNELAKAGARFTQSHFGQTPYGSGLPAHPSQPNYHFLFSGHHQGILPDWFEDQDSPYSGLARRDRYGNVLRRPMPGRVGIGNQVVPVARLPFQSPNLGAAIMQAGGTFASFSESLPYPSWNCASDSPAVPCEATATNSDNYRRKHNAVINWTDQAQPSSPRGLLGDLKNFVLPVRINLGFEPTIDPVLKQSFRGFRKDLDGKPLGFEALPEVAIVIPNEQHDAHSNSARAANTWLRRELADYADWASTHNSLLIVTFDEDGSTDASHGDPNMSGRHPIPTIFFGANVQAGDYPERIDHLNVLSTVLWLHGALDRFKADFRDYYRVTGKSDSEAEREYRNLMPITHVFKTCSQARC